MPAAPTELQSLSRPGEDNIDRQNHMLWSMLYYVLSPLTKTDVFGALGLVEEFNKSKLQASAGGVVLSGTEYHFFRSANGALTLPRLQYLEQLVTIQSYADNESHTRIVSPGTSRIHDQFSAFINLITGTILLNDDGKFIVSGPRSVSALALVQAFIRRAPTK